MRMGARLDRMNYNRVFRSRRPINGRSLYGRLGFRLSPFPFPPARCPFIFGFLLPSSRLADVFRTSFGTCDFAGKELYGSRRRRHPTRASSTRRGSPCRLRTDYTALGERQIGHLRVTSHAHAPFDEILLNYAYSTNLRDNGSLGVFTDESRAAVHFDAQLQPPRSPSRFLAIAARCHLY